MRKYSYLWCLPALMLMVLCGCGGGSGSEHPADPAASASSGASTQQEFSPGEIVQLEEETVFDYENYDWQSKLRGEAFEAGTVLGDAALDALSLSLDTVTDSTITVTVSAPDVSASLLDWYESSYTDESALEAQILTLLAGEKTTGSFTLAYTVTDENEPVVDYSAEYAAAVSCGLLEFYTALEDALLDALGGGLYD